MAPSQSSQVKKFLEFTKSTNAEVANFFLKRCSNQVMAAINDYYNNSHLAQKFNKESSSELSLEIDPRLELLFDKYKDPSPDGLGKPFIGIDGTIAYLADLGYEPEDIAVLSLAEFLESPSVGVFKKDAFLKNWTRQGCITLEQMRDFIESQLKVKLKTDPEYFKKIYSFTYKFILEPKEKNVPYETAIDYWRLMIPIEYEKELNTFIEFVETESKASINKDQWNMLPPFLKHYKSDPKMETYDENQSWPVLMDEFVEWLADKGKI
ncbi:hypothetical protein CANARDRAFT_9760 [[Candida] arabinofermentans NRRL YB-2248]|uniref:Defective in cullin neddylation protein n=1 Tax=[Candida] arabinofermentans NRRL YB-2248 TaxID=983967 RepID=A0A1E4SV05_9ASCO|nr:hypothetical protein CANARDRAFT_9760 [[Candida] arabinofermentans NRRL YB-2248]